MPASAVDIHPDARAEAGAAIDWYMLRSVSAALNFEQAVERGIELIRENPDAWPPFLHNTRHYVLPRFPFSIVYRVADGRIQVYAVAHAKRRPGYWRKRKLHLA